MTIQRSTDASASQNKLIVDGDFVADLTRMVLTESDPEAFARYLEQNTNISIN
jgi:hypothetical protein